ncbi:hypothetical protein [Sphingobacterium multivorum]|uniref:hypothetical protein n=1 Tax=Sphingobacterium multivorum TaxID=28454 RepID=UPI003DA5A472
MILQIAGIYYQFFAQSKDFTLSEIKRKQIRDELIERRPNELDKNKVNKAYFLLLYLGLIDRVSINGKIVYRLTQTTRICGDKRTILINYSLPNSETIFTGLNYSIIDNDSEVVNEDRFDVLGILKNIPKVSNIIKTRFIDVIEKPVFKFLEKWQPQKTNDTWTESKEFDIIPSLYKVYSFDKAYFEYFFWNRGKFYKFPLNDFVTLQLVKSFLQILNKRIAFKYDETTEELNESLPALEPIRKVLFTYHILTTGNIPLEYNYQVNGDIYKQLKRIYR